MRSLIVGVLFCLVTLLPIAASACGWWGDAENDASQDAITVDAAGRRAPSEQLIDGTPEALTRQANRLRRFGVSGYAGALRLYRQAADADFAPAQNNLAMMYEEGLGVVSDLTVAIQWYRRAAELGEANAQHHLGKMLLAGRGLEQDIDEGIQLIEQAAKQGHATACADLARLYRRGEYLKKDIEKARYWRQQAAQNEYPNAQQAIDAPQ
ncbi:MAG: tetratricopeptide repeat protein [Candidatus Thiodiazotropha sp.]|jgi:TPR repeat protein